MHAVLTLSELIEFLVEAKCIDQETQNKVRQYIQANQVTKSVLDKSPKQSKFILINLEIVSLTHQEWNYSVIVSSLCCV